MKRLSFLVLAGMRAVVLLFCLCDMLDEESRASESGESGMVVFVSPPADYPQAVEFQTLIRGNVAYSQATLRTGKRIEIPNNGIVAIVHTPPATPSSAALDSAGQVLAQIESTLKRYPSGQFPQVANKLEPLAASWRAYITASRNLRSTTPVPAPLKSGPLNFTITTIDGQRYDDVVVTKADTESVSFEHSAGVATVPLAKLPPDLQKRFNYDPNRVPTTKPSETANSAATPPTASAKNLAMVPGIPKIGDRGSGQSTVEKARQEQEREDREAKRAQQVQQFEAVKKSANDAILKLIAEEHVVADRPGIANQSPSFGDTVQFINGKIGGDWGEMWYGKTTGKMILFGRRSVAVFDPADFSPNVKFGTERNIVTVECTNGKRLIELHHKGTMLMEGESPTGTTNALTFTCKDNLDKQRLVDAWVHLIEMFGGKLDAF